MILRAKKAKIVNSINFHRHNRIQSCVLVFYNSLSIELKSYMELNSILHMILFQIANKI
jgi:hypothetical protein